MNTTDLKRPTRTLAELDEAISNVPQEWRRYCTARICGCMGCVQAGLGNKGIPFVTQQEFETWAAAFPEKLPAPVDYDKLNADLAKALSRYET